MDTNAGWTDSERDAIPRLLLARKTRLPERGRMRDVRLHGGGR